MDAKAAYYQVELQVAAATRRLQKAWEILETQRTKGDKNCEAVCMDVSTCLLRAQMALCEVRRLKNEFNHHV